ncbi:ShlB/FhaC/HecB family hemolysin secretion/activation protein [Sedimenticola sp.]|uniref:ShlB/FhaC/HecB family hemolysin secretion/activation protein n=1 Tax=Sedimenticola sp. TaxID=1940285 RepID=UPI003D1439CC
MDDRKGVFAGIVGVTISILFHSVLYAATPQELGFQQNEQLLREQQQQLKMQERERLLRELERSLIPIEVPKPEEKRKPGIAAETCFVINEIELQGADNLLQSEKQQLVQPWLGMCMTLDDIDTLRVEIDRYYIEKGWVMSRTYLQPGQNLKAGKLIFKVLEGTLNEIRLNDNRFGDRVQAAMAFPGMRDEIINIRDIEQGLDQINRLQSNRATMGIEPVKGKPGYSDIMVKNKPNNPYRFFLGYDNQGSESTGKERGKLSGDLDNLFSLNDHIYIMATDYVGDSTDGTDSESMSVNVDIPYGYWNYGLGANYSKYVSIVDDPITPFQMSGESTGSTVKVTRVLSRGKKSKTSASAVLNLKESTTYLEDVKLESSSRKLTVFDLQLLHILRQDSTVWSLQAGYSRGLELFDALLDVPGTGDDIPKAQFEKLSWDVSVTHGFKALEYDWTYRGVLSGQWSSDPLFGSEQIAMGDLNTVRGFRDSPVSGDSGMYFKNDLVWYAPSSLKYLKGMSFSAGLDFGYASVKNDNIANTGKGDATLIGVSVGASQAIRFAWDQQLSWSVSIGKSISAPEFVEEEDMVAFFDLSWKFW